MARGGHEGHAGVAVWLAPEQVGFVRAAAAAGKFRVAHAGSPVKGQSGHVAAELGCPQFDDLRATLAEVNAPLVWLATAGDFGATGSEVDARAVLAASQRGVKIATTEPVPSSVLDLRHAGWGVPGSGGESGLAGERLRYVGLPRLTRPWREGQEVLAGFGTPRLVQVEAWSGLGQGTLGARLLGAMDLIASVMGEPETIDAAYVGPRQTAGLHSLPGETLHEVHGDLAATLRFHDGRAAVITASNAAGRWNSVVTLISNQGRLRFYDDGFEWIGPDGEKRDEQRLVKRSRGDAGLTGLGARVAGEAIARLLDEHAADPGPVALGQVLPLCQAALLSARTGNPESPETIRRMMLVG